MVVKRRDSAGVEKWKFENDVILYGSQTYPDSISCMTEDVILYGSQTNGYAEGKAQAFENDVILYGSQTALGALVGGICLRMM